MSLDVPLVDPRIELAKAALFPLVAGVAPRCPRCGTQLPDPTANACPRCHVVPSAAEAATRLLPVASAPREVLRGASYVARGFFTLVASPRLWAVAALPTLVNLAVFGLALWLELSLLERALGSFNSDPNALATWTGWWAILKWVVKVIAWLGTWVVTKWLILPLVTAWLMGAFPFAVVLRSFFMPFSTMMGERTEQLVLQLPAASRPFTETLPLLMPSVTRSIRNTILLLLFQGLLYVVLLPIAFLPPVWMVLPPAIMAGMDHTDPTFCRKDYSMRERIALWKARKWRFLGFGATFFFFLGVPFVNALIFPIVACGAALLYLELDRK